MRLQAITLSVLVVFFVGIIPFLSHTETLDEGPTCYDPTQISIPVLMYHYISPGNAQEYWTTSYAEFQRQMQWFHDEGFSALTVDDFYEFIKTGNIENPRSFLPIFDDNWYDSIKNRVLPVMRQYGFTATLALFTNGISHQGSGVFTWSELRQWEREGVIDVQSHSVTHPLSPALNQLSMQQIWRELSISKFYLEYYLQKTITGFITPGGSTSGQIKFFAKLAGYKTLFLLWENGGIHYQADPLSIYRVNMVNTLTFDSFVSKMNSYSTPNTIDSVSCLTQESVHVLPFDLDTYTVVAYYGHPSTPNMGILGAHSPEELAQLVNEQAQQFDAVNGDKGVLGAFHLVFATVQPDGRTLALADDVIRLYIEVARANGMLVILDHQIGAGSLTYAVQRMLPYLQYENVHLAIDPEWRRSNYPERGVGSVTGYEINEAQQLMQDYMEQNSIDGKKMLIVHQFSSVMITLRSVVRTDYASVQLVHDMDGFGPPALKLASYAYNALADNMPRKGFKLFFPIANRPWGYDIPLMSPQEVMLLIPQPQVIIYQ